MQYDKKVKTENGLKHTIKQIKLQQHVQQQSVIFCTMLITYIECVNKTALSLLEATFELVEVASIASTTLAKLVLN